MGVSRLDSIRAMIPAKKDISKEDLLQSLNHPLPEAPIKEPVSDVGDLQGTASQEAKLPNVPDLGAVKLPDSTLHDLLPARAFQFPSDSLGIIDSLKVLNLERQKLQLDESNADEQLKNVVVKNKPRFWDKTYFEGVLSFVQNKDNNSFRFSPAMGYRLKDNLSFGLGPNIFLQQKEKPGRPNSDTGCLPSMKYSIKWLTSRQKIWQTPRRSTQSMLNIHPIAFLAVWDICSPLQEASR